MTSRQLRNQRREAERKARKLEYQQNRSSAAAAPAFAPVVEHLDDTSPVGATPASPAIERKSGATGPRTPEGKAISCANSLKHGLASGRLIIPGEDREDFEALLNDLVAEHTPATPTEEMLVQQMAQSWWLMHRAIRIQNQAFLETWCDMKKLALFLRYQTTYERAFYRALNSLKKLQKERLAAARDFVSQEKGTGLSVPKHAVKSPSHSLRSGQTGPSPAPKFVSQNRTTAPTPSVGARHAAPFQPATTAFEPASGQNGLDGSSRTACTYNS